VPTVRHATPADLPAIGRALAAAFEDDPVWMWVAGPRADWSTRAAAWFATEARLKMAGPSEVLVDDEVHGIAIWAPPKHWRNSVLDGLRILLPSLRLFRSRLPRGLVMVHRVEKLHPREPHWYLALLGTDPDHQGKGIGGALIEEVTRRCDEQGLGAYLESSKEQNVPYYARFGFVVQGEIHVTDGPTMWRMWREPKR